MRILWLTNTPAGASEFLKIKRPSGAWISALEAQMKAIEDVNLGVCFFYDGPVESRFVINSVTYYPIKTKGLTLVDKVNSKLFNVLDDTNKTALLKAVEDFQPEIIQLFGTESGLGEILTEIKIPVIIHIQGLINPCLAAWLPRGISQKKLIYNSPLKNILSKKGILGEFYLMKKRATREISIIKAAHYFFGRTKWDEKVVRLYNQHASYFHCDELLRPEFFSNRWISPADKLIRLVTTINPNIYKGLDVVLDTACALAESSAIEFEWNIIGITDSDQLVSLFERIKKKRFRDFNVIFRGYKDTCEMIDLLLASNIFIHPSHIDNSPNSVCEAMALGMPVVAGYVGGIPTLIENNVSGVLYNSHDPFDLAGTIVKAASNKEELERLGNNARKTAIHRHDANLIVETIIETYRSILGTLKHSSDVAN